MQIQAAFLLSLLCCHAVFCDARERFRPRRRDDTTVETSLAENPCRGKPLDFVFIIDSSRSVRPHDYEKVKTFVLNILKFLDIGSEATRVGLLQYGSLVQNEFSLNTFHRKSDMEQAVKNMLHLASGTMTGLALQYTMDVAFSEAEGARPLDRHVPRVAMVVTDGRPQDTVAEIAAKARTAGIQIFAIGVGRVEMSTLRAMGSEPHAEHVYLVANFSQIQTLTSIFQIKLCGGSDLCSVVDHQCEHYCASTPTSYTCRCRKGFLLNPDGKTCREDMCAAVEHKCEHICTSLLGAYECRCQEGYLLAEDQKSCYRMDYCSQGQHGCEHVCVSAVDSYTCSCRKGFLLNPDGKTCSRIDLCALESHGCEHECANTEDSFVCRCRLGYTLNADGKTCTKIDVCSLGSHGCEHECVNTEDSFVCQCRKGYALNTDGRTCTRVDLCALEPHGCEHECINTEDLFVCRCRKGYRLNTDGKTCSSVDTCSTVEHGCEHLCISVQESYLCKCSEGYILAEDGRSCRRPECARSGMDLMFVIDGSKSLGQANFELVKQFVTTIVDSLSVSASDTQVGLIQYSTKVRREFTLSQFRSGAAVKEAVAHVQYMGRGSMTGSALRHMFESSFSPKEGARPGVPRVCIVFTDGRAQDDVSQWATKAHDAGITIYAVGVGKAIEEELREIASEPDDRHLYYAEDFSRMDDITDKIKSRICEEKPSEAQLCRCDNVVAFQKQAAEQLKRLTQKLAVVSSRLEVLENHLGQK